jgi:hypothetical protein
VAATLYGLFSAWLLFPSSSPALRPSTVRTTLLTLGSGVAGGTPPPDDPEAAMPLEIARSVPSLRGGNQRAVLGYVPWQTSMGRSNETISFPSTTVVWTM